VIPGNDDAIRSCGLVVKAIADGIEAGKQKVTPAELKAPRNGGSTQEEAPAQAEPAAEARAETPAAETPAPAAPEAPAEPAEGASE
jgi:small subunit ribosomal protein S2